MYQLQCFQNNLFSTFGFIIEILQTEETTEATDRKIPNLYPDLYNCGLENVEDVQKGRFF